MTWSRLEQHFAHHLTILEQAFALGSLLERQHLVDDRHEAAARHQIEQYLEIVFLPTVRTDQRVLVGPPVARIEREIVSGRGATAKDSAAYLHAFLRRRQCVPTGEVHRYVHTAGTGNSRLAVDLLDCFEKRFVDIVGNVASAN